MCRRVSCISITPAAILKSVWHTCEIRKSPPKKTLLCHALSNLEMNELEEREKTLLLAAAPIKGEEKFALRGSPAYIGRKIINMQVASRDHGRENGAKVGGGSNFFYGWEGA